MEVLLEHENFNLLPPAKFMEAISQYVEWFMDLVNVAEKINGITCSQHEIVFDTVKWKIYPYGWFILNRDLTMIPLVIGRSRLLQIVHDIYILQQLLIHTINIQLPQPIAEEIVSQICLVDILTDILVVNIER